MRDKFKKKFSLDSLNTRQTKTMDVESSQKSSELQTTEIPLSGRSESHVALDSLDSGQHNSDSDVGLMSCEIQYLPKHS